MMMHPMPVVDDWTLLPDGTLAVVRGSDYHVDWIAPDGARSSTPKTPFEWQRLSDEAKTAFVDSTRKAMEAMRAAGGAGGGTNVFVGGPSGGAPGGAPGGAMTMRIEMGGPPGGGPGAGAMTMTPPAITMVPIADLPDYRPAFGTGATRADLDGNLWVRTSKVFNGGPVYDVIDRRGVLVDRVAFPYGRVIAGFGAGVVYMGVRDEKGARLELARLR